MLLDSVSKPLPLTLIEWRPFEKNTLRGFATVQLGALKIIDVSVHALSDKKWCGLPAKPLLNSDGSAQRDTKGRIRYAQVMEWMNKETADRFRQAVFEVVERAHPDALTVK